jgi:outer membrane protein assembly factor BamB
VPSAGDGGDETPPRPPRRDGRSDPYAPERRSDARIRGDAYRSGGGTGASHAAHPPDGYRTYQQDPDDPWSPGYPTGEDRAGGSRPPPGYPGFEHPAGPGEAGPGGWYGERHPDDSAYGREPGGAAAQRRRRAQQDDRDTVHPASPGPRLATPFGQPLPRRASGPAHLTPRHDRRRLVVLLVIALLLVAGAIGVQQLVLAGDDDPADPGAAPADTTAPPAVEAPPTTPPPPQGPASGFAIPGLLTFRGSATRSYYGEGPVPTDPKVLWSYPGASGGMCSDSTVGEETRQWCGSGWTGQPAVFDRDGRTWVVFGAYDRKVHFVDYETGEDIIPPFTTGDIIKGSVTIDPDGMPLVYSGSRDDKLHVIAFDRPEPTELWSLDAEAVSPTKWNDDWDGSPLVIGDYLYEGGENSQFHVVKLNRTLTPDGLVQVDPELVFNAPGWDDELLGALNTRNNDVSIENSVAYVDGVVYFANSGGLVQGWDVSGLSDGVTPTRVFRFWTGDDVDASVVVDDEGFLYVGVENERGNARAAEVGQLVKLDPRRPDDPVVWSVKDPGGFWTTPALHDDVVIAAADGGTVYGVDRQTGAVRWTFSLPPPTWQSAVIVDDTLIQGDCEGGLHAYDVSDTTVAPPKLWSVSLEGCIESTPAVWKGRVFVGARGGRFYAIGDA